MNQSTHGVHTHTYTEIYREKLIKINGRESAVSRIKAAKVYI